MNLNPVAVGITKRIEKRLFLQVSRRLGLEIHGSVFSGLVRPLRTHTSRPFMVQQAAAELLGQEHDLDPVTFHTIRPIFWCEYVRRENQWVSE